MDKYSKACCSIPPVISQGYQPKGEYITLNGVKTYVTGPPTATKAIFLLYDIFGFFPQTLQGADILSTSSPTSQYRVYIPDLFDGTPAHISWYPPDTDEKKTKLGAFFTERAPPGLTLPRIPGLVGEADKLAPSGGKYEAWGVVGFCWGGKIATLLATDETPLFKAAVQCHPAMLDPQDAESVKIPMALLASGDEDEKEVKEFGDRLKVENKFVETWKGQIHGWMAARADLEDEGVRGEFEAGYRAVLGFLGENM